MFLLPIAVIIEGIHLTDNSVCGIIYIKLRDNTKIRRGPRVITQIQIPAYPRPRQITAMNPHHFAPTPTSHLEPGHSNIKPARTVISNRPGSRKTPHTKYEIPHPTLSATKSRYTSGYEMRNTKFAKQTQFQKQPKHPKPTCCKDLQRTPPRIIQRKQTQSNPISSRMHQTSAISKRSPELTSQQHRESGIRHRAYETPGRFSRKLL